MDNTYLCRGERVDNGEWVVGFLWVNRSISRETYHITDDYGDIHDVDPATIGKCTGISAAKSYRGDKPEDKLVFEGDVIVFDDEEHEVKYRDACFWMVLIQDDSYAMELYTILLQSDAEIIGNIHDRTEATNES